MVYAEDKADGIKGESEEMVFRVAQKRWCKLKTRQMELRGRCQTY